MLDYRRDRLDYGEMLVPPQGYGLERAVAATYSVDLNTLLSIPIALIYAQTLEGKLDGERFQILEAIQKVSSLATVYHQKGQLHVPDRYNRLYAFLEPMLVPIYPETAFTAFHPKVWVLRYQSDDGDKPPVYRALILSRNLTYDRSWDVAVCLEGTENAEKQDRSQPLADFLRHLNGVASFPDAAEFIQGVHRTKFESPAGFRRALFHPIGIPRYYVSPISGCSAEVAVVISPFVDAKGIQTVRDRVSGDVHIFSRGEELRKVEADVLSGLSSCYAISDWVVEGERRAEVDDSASDVREQDLHAKVYVFEGGGQTRWMIGSANATQAALTRNTEFMVELVGDERQGGVKALLKELLGEDGQLGVFEKFDPTVATGQDPGMESRNALRQAEYALLDAPVNAKISRNENQTNWDLRLSVDLKALRLPAKLSIRVRPLNIPTEPAPIESGKVNEIAFPNIKETELTRFLVFSIRHADADMRSFLVRIDIEGMPASRNDSIFKSIVNSRDKFFQYLCFLLSEDRSKGDLVDDGDPNGDNGGDDDAQWIADVPIFENLLVAASRDPRKLRSVDALIGRLRDQGTDGDAIVPAEFLDFWDVFRPLIPPAAGVRK